MRAAQGGSHYRQAVHIAKGQGAGACRGPCILQTFDYLKVHTLCVHVELANLYRPVMWSSPKFKSEKKPAVCNHFHSSAAASQTHFKSTRPVISTPICGCLYSQSKPKAHPGQQNRLTGVRLIRFRTEAAGRRTCYSISKACPPHPNRISPPAENRRPPPSGPSRPSSGTGCSPGQNCPGPPRYTPARRRSS